MTHVSVSERRRREERQCKATFKAPFLKGQTLDSRSYALHNAGITDLMEHLLYTLAFSILSAITVNSRKVGLA
jgi:hypothetical protein